VQTPSEEPTVIDARTQRLLGDTLTLANQLGATVFTFKGQDVADTILRFAREYRVGQVVIGRPRPIPWWRRLTGERSVAEELIRRSQGVTLVVVDAESEEPTKAEITAATGKIDPANRPAGTLGRLLTPGRILVWDDPVSRMDVREGLVKAIVAGNPALDSALIMARLGERESQGSTFLNEGVALPHARIDGLANPEVAIGLTHGGILDAPTDRPIEVVFLLLSPTDGAGVHLQLLARVGRALQSRDLRKSLMNARSAPEALEAMRDFEAAASGDGHR
jgi:two-component system sensor histidine kinase KdpD